MKNLIIFLILLILFIGLYLGINSTVKTRDGHKLERFEVMTTKVLPPILSDYLRNSNIRFAVYKIPNYVKDLMTYHKNFSGIYGSKNKVSIIVFVPKDKVKSDAPAFVPFYDKLQKLIKEYSTSFNLISIEYDNKSDYIYAWDKVAYQDLEKYCEKFCLIDPKNDLMFVFKYITNTEVDALDVVFQQYSYMQHH